MRVPIQNALTWPALAPCAFGRLELDGLSLDFREPEPERYPLLGLAYGALSSGRGSRHRLQRRRRGRRGGLRGRPDQVYGISREVVALVLENAWPSRARELESIFDIDSRAREAADAAVREIEC